MVAQEAVLRIQTSQDFPRGCLAQYFYSMNGRIQLSPGLSLGFSLFLLRSLKLYAHQSPQVCIPAKYYTMYTLE